MARNERAMGRRLALSADAADVAAGVRVPIEFGVNDVFGAADLLAALQ
jgi:hypothetical protein